MSTATGMSCSLFTAAQTEPRIQLSIIMSHPVLYLFQSTRTASLPAAATLTGGKPRR